jgi:transposase
MRHSITDRAAHVAAWESSGLSQAGYCRQTGLAYHLFRDWVRRRSAGEGKVASGFVEVRRPPVGGVAVMALPGGARLEFGLQADPAWAGQVIRAVLAPC